MKLFRILTSLISERNNLTFLISGYSEILGKKAFLWWLAFVDCAILKLWCKFTRKIKVRQLNVKLSNKIHMSKIVWSLILLKPSRAINTSSKIHLFCEITVFIYHLTKTFKDDWINEQIIIRPLHRHVKNKMHHLWLNVRKSLYLM